MSRVSLEFPFPLLPTSLICIRIFMTSHMKLSSTYYGKSFLSSIVLFLYTCWWYLSVNVNYIKFNFCNWHQWQSQGFKVTLNSLIARPLSRSLNKNSLYKKGGGGDCKLYWYPKFYNNIFLFVVFWLENFEHFWNSTYWFQTI